MTAVRVRVVMNHTGARYILKGPEMQAYLFEKGCLVRDAAGGAPDFEAFIFVGSARSRCVVITKTIEGKRLEAEGRVLSMALDSAR